MAAIRCSPISARTRWRTATCCPARSYQDLFARVATAYADDADHAQRLYDYISKLWFMPATPVLSNGGTGRGLPISCFLNSCRRQPRRASSAPGTRTSGWPPRRRHRHLLGRRPRHRRAGQGPQRQDQRHHPLRPGDGQPHPRDQPGLAAPRLGRLSISTSHHPEIEEFLEIRKPSGDFNRKALNLHHGVLVTDEFMEAVRDGAECSACARPRTARSAQVDARAAVPEAGRDPPADRRALHHLHRHR
jgi:ribonucleoside-diphosphate reductase alpha chain